MEFNDVADLKTYLEGLSENTEDNPYPVKVNGVNLSSTGAEDTLKALYSALLRYVELDLTDCVGIKFANITPDTAPNKAKIVSIILPDTVTTIDVNAFVGCTALKSVSMPKVTYITNGAFKSCEKLESVYMPEVLTIKESGSNANTSAFYKCTALTSVSLPKIASIGKNTFYGCTALSSITLGTEPPDLGTDVFKDTPLSAIYVPAAALTAYQGTGKENWADLKAKVTAIAN
ncbi:MAG: leucine-rich repeat domain-containing protein [Treponema sp.]|nr:leucine-rich repeat domain-containing protein [Treponema sp.]